VFHFTGSLTSEIISKLFQPLKLFQKIISKNYFSDIERVGKYS